MKKEFVGRVTDRSGANGYWTFDTNEHSYGMDVVIAIDKLLDTRTKNGSKFKITIEQLN